jgi:hypothetical protein
VGRFGDGCLEHQNIPTGPGDGIKIDASWAVGDTKNVISTSGASPSFAIFGDAGHALAQAGDRPAFSYTSIKDYVAPEQIADQIVFMCSPRDRTISGRAISICGDTQMLG